MELWVGLGRKRRTAVVGLGLAVVLALGGLGYVVAQSEPIAPPVEAPVLHPDYPLRDAAGVNVLESGAPVSPMATCGACHDTEFIATHSFHADAGLGEMGAPGTMEKGRPWDTSPGLFGKWNPILYRYLSPQGDEVVDLTTPEWLQVIGRRQAGGGPGTTSREGLPLESLAGDAGDVEASARGAEGTLAPWDWAESGTVEMNCFLCHTPDPDNAARIATLEAGNFAWAATATLGKMGLVRQDGEEWSYNGEAFDAEGNVLMAVQDPTNANCGNCHGVVHTDNQVPLTMGDLSLNEWSTLTTGQVNSPQKIAQSGLNIAGKVDLARSWDIHAERVLQCTDCHYALNNPVYYQDLTDSAPEHLQFDPRRVDIGEYLYRPLHQFAKGNSAQGTLAPELDNTLRRCESCHSIEATHNWLPYKERHVNAVACESCHIPELFAPSLEYLDWTVLQEDGGPVVSYRGIEGDSVDATTLITPYEPVLLPRADVDGGARLAPFNLVSSWYWVYGDPARPVPLESLQAAWLDEEGYRPEMLGAFDGNGDGFLTESELVIDGEGKETAVASALAAQGLVNPRIVADTEPYSINHDVTNGSWLSRDCRQCHSDDSRLAAPLSLSDRTPGGVTPIFVSGGPVAAAGAIVADEAGALRFDPQTEEAGLYVLGHDGVSWVDWLGVLMFLGVLLGVVVHGGLRVISARRMAKEGRGARGGV